MTWRKPSSWVHQFLSLQSWSAPLFLIEIFFWVEIFSWVKTFFWIKIFFKVEIFFWVEISFWIEIFFRISHHHFHSSGFLSFTSLPSSGSLWIYLTRWKNRQNQKTLFDMGIWKSLYFTAVTTHTFTFSRNIFSRFHWCITIMQFFEICSSTNLRLQYKNIYTPKLKKVNRVPDLCEFNEAEDTESMKWKAVTNCSKNLPQAALSSLGHSARLAVRCRRAHIQWEPGQGVRAVRVCVIEAACTYTYTHTYTHTYTYTFTYTFEHILIHLCIIDVHNWVRARSGGTRCTKLYMCVFLCTFVYRYT